MDKVSPAKEERKVKVKHPIKIINLLGTDVEIVDSNGNTILKVTKNKNPKVIEQLKQVQVQAVKVETTDGLKVPLLKEEYVFPADFPKVTPGTYYLIPEKMLPIFERRGDGIALTRPANIIGIQGDTKFLAFRQ